MTHPQPWLAQLLETACGIDPSVLGEAHLRAALRARMDACGIGCAEAYRARVETCATERETLLAALTVPETWFFREPAAFGLLAREAGALGRPPHILCAPCSSGEEAYSAAIALRRAGVCEYVIHGVDLSRQAIDAAERGLYGAHSFRGDCTPQSLGEYLRPVEHAASDAPAQPTTAGLWAVREELRAGLTFRAGNLHQPGTFAFLGRFDFIFCRNLLIYMTVSARAGLVRRLFDRLAPGGILFTGHAELTAASAVCASCMPTATSAATATAAACATSARAARFRPVQEKGVFALRKTSPEDAA